MNNLKARYKTKWMKVDWIYENQPNEWKWIEFMKINQIKKQKNEQKITRQIDQKCQKGRVSEPMNVTSFFSTLYYVTWDWYQR